MKFPHGFEVTVTRPAGYDRHGNPLPGTTHTIGRCARDQITTREVTDGTLVVTSTERLLCDDPRADVGADDIVTLPDGSRWRVTGDPDRPQSPFTGWEPGLVAPIERSTGSSLPQE